MKLTKAVFSGLVFTLLCLIPLRSSQASLGDIHVNYLEGDVQIRSAEAAAWIPAAMNMPVEEGEAIWVPEGDRAAILVRDGTVVRLDEYSSLEIPVAERDSVQLYLPLGHAYINFSGREGSFLQIDTPVATTRVYDRARFRINVDDRGFTEISVFSGEVYIEAGGGETRVVDGNILTVREGGNAELALLGPADDWERWNEGMDRRYERRYSTRYLPAELEPYAYEFDEYGEWVSTREYGYVWTPRAVGADWAPYRQGRWTWIAGDYVWVSYDSWGWTPYHYGRWAYVRSFGWCWVPPERHAVYWSPGYVAWVSTPTYVSWIPLAPGETYYGYGDYGPQSVNITNIDITRIQVTNVYRNVSVASAVTAVSRDTFVSGRPADLRLRENPFTTQRVNVGRPGIAPTRESYLPVVKSVPPALKPPREIRQLQASRIRDSRPIEKDRAKSVMRPGRSLEPMEIRILDEQRRPGTARQPGVESEAVGREIHKPRGGPTQRSMEEPRGVPPGRAVEEPRRGQQGRSIEEPRGMPPGRAMEQPHPIPQERTMEGPRGMPQDRSMDQPRPFPQERTMEEPRGVPPGRAVEQPRPIPQERAIEEPRGMPPGRVLNRPSGEAEPGQAVEPAAQPQQQSKKKVLTEEELRQQAEEAAKGGKKR